MYVKKDFIIILNKIRLPLKCLFLFMCFLYFTLKHIYSEKKKKKKKGGGGKKSCQFAAQ